MYIYTIIYCVIDNNIVYCFSLVCYWWNNNIQSMGGRFMFMLVAKDICRRICTTGNLLGCWNDSVNDSVYEKMKK